MSRACIPFHILFDKDLSKNELILYGMIEQMESEGKHVFFNNRTIAEKLGLNHESGNVRKMIAHLTAKQYIKREQKHVKFKRKGEIVLELKWCFSTVKSLVIEAENEPQGGVAEEPPITGVAEEPPRGVAEEPPYISPLLVEPLTKKLTNCIFLSKEKDKELLDLKAKHIPKDKRTNEEFLKQAKHHLEHGKNGYSKEQKYFGLKKLIASGNFLTPLGYKSENLTKPNNNSIWTDEQKKMLADYKHGLILKNPMLMFNNNEQQYQQAKAIYEQEQELIKKYKKQG